MWYFNFLVPPYFRKRPRSTQARQNEDVLFECDVYGIPKPSIRWRKNGDIVIPSDYFQIVDGRNLKILGLVNSDQGLYQCFGENAVGSIQASAQLLIVDQGKIIVPDSFFTDVEHYYELYSSMFLIMTSTM